MALTHINFSKGLLMENLSLEWRVSPQHVALLPVSAKIPNFPIELGLPMLGDLVQIGDGDFWVIGARQWQRDGSGWVLVLQIAPAADTPDIGSHTLH